MPAAHKTPIAVVPQVADTMSVRVPAISEGVHLPGPAGRGWRRTKQIKIDNQHREVPKVPTLRLRKTSNGQWSTAENHWDRAIKDACSYLIDWDIQLIWINALLEAILQVLPLVSTRPVATLLSSLWFLHD